MLLDIQKKRRLLLKMRAIHVNEDTRELYIGKTKDPICHQNDLLINVKATALNRADILQRQGKYPPPKGESKILGLEMAGVVEKVGNKVKGWEVGDRVCALLPGGGYAEKVVIPSKMAIRIPEELSFEKAAAIPEAFLTAYLNLVQLGKIKEKEYVLIHAGASGVGTAAIQIAKTKGAIPIVTAGSSEKTDFCLSLGAEYALNYKEGDFSEKILDITSGKGVDVILDFIGATFWHYNMRSISTDGRWIFVGSLGGREIKEVNLGQFLKKRIMFVGSTLRTRNLDFKINLTNNFIKFADRKLKNEELAPVIDSIYNWEEVQLAHDRMLNNLNIGKIVLKIN